MSARPRRVTVLGRALVSMILVCGFVQLGPAATSRADTLPPPGQPATASAQDLPTWQINGVAWAQLVIGNTVYVTGNFTKARPPGMWVGGPTEIPVAHLMAYDIRTGERIASFNHQLNAQGLALAASADGSRLYVGGDFTAVDNEARGHIAAFDTATGALVPDFDPKVNGQVRALAVLSGKLYAGGSFEGVQGVARRRLASFGLTDAKLTSWAPAADNGYVWALLAAPDASKVIVAGAFTTISSQAASGTAALHPDTGALLPWAMNTRIYVSGTSGSAITSLSTDGSAVYGGGFVYGQNANLEGTFSANLSDGTLRWVGDCLGDTYSVRPVGGVLYVASHSHDCRVIGGFPDTSPRSRWEHAMGLTTAPMKPITTKDAYGFDFRDQMSPNLLQFHPDLGIGQATGQYQAAWHVDGNDQYVVFGGEFPTVNGRPQQGLTRFSRISGAATMAPTFQTRPARTLTSPTAVTRRNTVTVRSQSAWDADNAVLHYELVRDPGTAAEAVVAQSDVSSNFWTLPEIVLTDPAAPDGPHTYRLKVSDQTGQVIFSPTSNEVTAGYGPYGKAVFADGPVHYWRLGQVVGDALDEITTGTATVNTGVTRPVASGIVTEADPAMRFSGTVVGNVIHKNTSTSSGAITMEAWVRTTSTSGGRFLALGTKQTANGKTVVSNDRQLYMTTDGRLGATVPSGAVKVESQPGFNDGKWHHTVATVGTAGFTLYVDGQQVAQLPTYKTTPSASGNWHIGGDRTGSSPNWTTWSLAGDVDDVAVYNKALSTAQVTTHFDYGTGNLPNQAPTAAFTSAVSGLGVSLDASGSKDPDGTIASYAWDFGDGTAPGSGLKVSHSYATPGTYTVRLTITDDEGATAEVAHDVTVTAPPPNQAPSAAFASAVTGLAVALDGTGSADADGTIATYTWDFGDGTAAGSGSKVSHTYSGPGTYQVRLTVTDNDGASDSVTQPVVLSGEVARDAFSRTLAGAWGAADLGGTWTITGPAAAFNVDGAQGSFVTVPRATRGANLAQASSQDNDLRLTLGYAQAATGGGIYTQVIARGNLSNGYGARVWISDAGAIYLIPYKKVAGADTDLGAAYAVPGIKHVAGATYRFAVNVSGAGTSTIRAKLWAVGATEPASWMVTATDGTTSLQNAGGVGLLTYLSGTATTPELTTTVDDVSLRAITP